MPLLSPHLPLLLRPVSSLAPSDKSGFVLQVVLRRREVLGGGGRVQAAAVCWLACRSMWCCTRICRPARARAMRQLQVLVEVEEAEN